MMMMSRKIRWVMGMVAPRPRRHLREACPRPPPRRPPCSRRPPSQPSRAPCGQRRRMGETLETSPLPLSHQYPSPPLLSLHRSSLRHCPKHCRVCRTQRGTPGRTPQPLFLWPLRPATASPMQPRPRRPSPLPRARRRPGSSCPWAPRPGRCADDGCGRGGGVCSTTPNSHSMTAL